MTAPAKSSFHLQQIAIPVRTTNRCVQRADFKCSIGSRPHRSRRQQIEQERSGLRIDGERCTSPTPSSPRLER